MSTIKRIYLDPQNSTFSAIMSRAKTFEISSNRRGYVWREQQLETLWSDIERMQKMKIQHFMGCLIFQDMDGRHFQVIDGQQRLVTLELLIIAVVHHLHAMVKRGEETEKNQYRIAHYRRVFLDVLNRITLHNTAKIKLNQHNDAHYKKIVESYKVSVISEITDTNRKINHAFEFFKHQLTPYDSGKKLVTLIDQVVNGMVFITLTVPDDLDAYSIFDTLNTRGVGTG